MAVTSAEPDAGNAPAAARPPRFALLSDAPGGRRLRWPAALIASLAAGAGLWVSFPPFDLWWLAPLCVAVLALVWHRQRARTGFVTGLVAGLAWFTPLLDWTGTQVGAWPWLLLAFSQAVFVAVLGAAAAAVRGVTDRWRWTFAPLTGALWVAMEALRDRIPFGGFPWGRLAFSQGDSPLLGVAWLGGAPLVTFAVALCGGLLAAAVARRMPRSPNAWTRPAALAAAAVLVVCAAPLLPTATPSAGTAVVAIVQGNVPRLGLEFNAQRRAVLDNHVAATVDLAERVRDGLEPQPDLVIWPENSSDIDPFRNPDAAAAIDTAARAIDAPILVGALVRGPDGRNRNSALVAEPGRTPHVEYVKRNLVPFVEQVPMRSLVAMITDKVELAGNFAPGTEPGLVTMAGVDVGDVICYEIAFDDVVRDTVDLGADLIAVQTNNATFDNAEALQQLAMVRLRAVEYGRSALMASTVGVSAYVDADGTVHEATEFNTRAALVRTVGLGDGVTPAHVLGMLPELLLAAGAAAALGAALLLRRGRRLEVDRRSGGEDL